MEAGRIPQWQLLSKETLLAEEEHRDHVMRSKQGLTHKQQAFVDVYDGNTTKAAAMAGISRSYASRIMMDGAKQSSEPSALAVQTAIQERNKDNKDIADRQERQKFWSDNMRDESADISVRLKASELLGKSELDFGERRLDETPQSLADIAALLASKRRAVPSKVMDEGQDG
ncbi:MAG: terminase small subunit [Planctomycetota bacterium]|jgi:hypothetical protein